MNQNGIEVHVVGWAQRFLFRPDQLDLPVGELSGGERARVLLAGLMLEEADVLVLDEPTNDLDIPTLDVLETALSEFPGAVVLITHDRLLLERASDELLSLDGKGGVKLFASLHQWERDRAARLKGEADAKRAAVAPPKMAAAPAKKLKLKERLELERMEAAILEAESAVEAMQAKVASPDIVVDHVKLTAAYEQLGEAQATVDRLYARWDELEKLSA